jgi:hypothetical protein
MMFLNMAVRARALMVSPWRMATVRAVALSRPAVMIPSGSGTDGAVIEEDVDMVLRRQQGDDIALENEVRAVAALDGLGDLWVGGVEQIADLAADGLLPVGQGIDVGINAGVSGFDLGPTIVVEAAGGQRLL